MLFVWRDAGVGNGMRITGTDEVIPSANLAANTIKIHPCWRRVRTVDIEYVNKALPRRRSELKRTIRDLMCQSCIIETKYDTAWTA